jgi:tRNA G26 N,N-dimethylase Trm1
LGSLPRHHRKLSHVYQCNGCGALHFQPLGRCEGKGASQRFLAASGPPVNRTCDDCGRDHKVRPTPVATCEASAAANLSSLQVLGPIWNKSLFHEEFIKKAMEELEKNSALFKTHKKVNGYLAVLSQVRRAHPPMRSHHQRIEA